jgi:hypothetical protein
VDRAAPSLTAPVVAVAAAVLWLPILLLLLVPVPVGARPPLFVAGLAVSAALALWGGIRGRRALLEDTPSKVRAAVIAWLGLLLGGTTAVFCVWATIGLLA